MKFLSVGSLFATALVVVLFCSRQTDGCGQVTHMEISNRALQFINRQFKNVDIRQLLRKHQDAFQTGVVYPDSFYSPMCLDGAFVNTSQLTHGVNYIKAALDYFQQNYIVKDKIKDEAGEKLLAFILGNVAHDVQDRAWHGYGIDQGFLSTVSEANFHGNYSDAHLTADFGSDSVLLYELNFINLHLAISQWYVPQSDLYNIYKKLMCRPGTLICTLKDMRKAIAYCSRVAMGRGMLNKMLIHRWYVAYGMKAPIVISPRLNDYFMGGLNDMTSWTMQRMETALLYLEDTSRNKNNCTQTSSDDNPLYWICGKQPRIVPPPNSWIPQHDSARSSAIDLKESKQRYMAKLFQMTEEYVSDADGKSGLLGTDDDIVETVEDKATGGLFFKAKGALRRALQDATMNDLLEYGETQREASDTEEQTDQFVAAAKDHYKYYIKKAYSLVGQSMVSADLNNDGADDLIVGVPGYSEDNRFDEGRVYVVTASARGLPAEDLDLERSPNSQVITAPFNGTGRFGYAIVVLDFNDDTLPDIVISAPVRTNDVINKPYSGFVYVYYGQADGKFKESPDVTIDCNMRYCNYGTTLSVGDVDGNGKPDLIIGSPYASQSFEKNRQNGFVSVFYSGTFGRQERFNSYTAANIVVWGISQYSWFGTSAISTSFCDLLIGAPGQKTASSFANKCTPNLQMAGAVYCYSRSSGSLNTFARGSKEFEFFGATLAEGHPNGKTAAPVLAIGAPNSDNIGKLVGFLPYLMRQSGTVYLYNSKTKTLIDELVGDRLYGAFGRVMKFADIDGDDYDDLLVSAPARSTDVTNVLYGPGIGELYLYYGRSDFPSSALSRSCETRFTPCPADQADGVFGTGLRRGQLGSNAVFLRSTNVTQMVVAQQRTDDYARQSGKLLLFNNCLSLA